MRVVGPAALLLLAISVTVSAADTVTLAHTGWAMVHAGVVSLASSPAQHGDPSLYEVAPPIPDPQDGAWKTLTGAPSDVLNPVDINYLGPRNDYSSDLSTCLTQVDFTYFQTTVAIPANFTVSSAQISLGPLDDGARVLVFNSAYPGGVVPQDGLLMLGDTRTVDLSQVVKSGEGNRVVVQHVDDCAAQGWLGRVELTVTGQQQAFSANPTWGEVKNRYH